MHFSVFWILQHLELDLVGSQDVALFYLSSCFISLEFILTSADLIEVDLTLSRKTCGNSLVNQIRVLHTLPNVYFLFLLLLYWICRQLAAC